VAELATEICRIRHHLMRRRMLTQPRISEAACGSQFPEAAAV
jgi:hypothetical protein